jgi:hypothetical protein
MEAWEQKNALVLTVPRIELRKVLRKTEKLSRSERHLMTFLAVVGLPVDYKTIEEETSMSRSLLRHAKKSLAQRGLINVLKVAI